MSQTLETSQNIQFYTRSIASFPNIVYYNDDHVINEPPRCTSTLAQQMGCTWSLAANMMELIREIEYGAEFIAFHIEMIERSGLDAADFIRTIIVLSKFAPDQQQLKIMMVIKPTTPRQQVMQLKDLPISIGLDINYYTPEQTKLSCQELIAGCKYWPQVLIDQLPNSEELLLSVYFCKDHGSYITEFMSQQLKTNAKYQIQYCSNWDELNSALKKRPHQLVFHISTLTRLDLSISEIITSIKTEMTLSGHIVPIAVGIESDTTASVIKELKRAGVFGLVPSAVHWGAESAVIALNSLADRIPYWPKHIIDQLPGNKPAPDKKNVIAGIYLTSRQEEVLGLICRRGLSNKQIAKTLNLSESTVKIYVSAVMKAHGVRNRTQLALSAGTGLKA